ncbi:MAG: hypothetical protein L6Q57_08085 [Alphaproteobacteria bacterium]|nr:hypothetical protein [Alphaproteobacteria bacterium]
MGAVKSPLAIADQTLQQAENAGFAWPSADEARRKFQEECAEFEAALASGARPAIEDEFGDVIFSLISWGRTLDLNAETCLTLAMEKFKGRFQALEANLAREGLTLNTASRADIKRVWQNFKNST